MGSTIGHTYMIHLQAALSCTVLVTGRDVSHEAVSHGITHVIPLISNHVGRRVASRASQVATVRQPDSWNLNDE